MFFHFWDFDRFVYFCILHFRISAFPTFGRAEMQKCRNAERAESIDIVKVKNISKLLMFFTFHISIDLLLSENRLRFSGIRKSIELWKAKKHKQFAYVFSLLLCRFILVMFAFLHFCISALLKVGNADMRKYKMQK